MSLLSQTPSSSAVSNGSAIAVSPVNAENNRWYVLRAYKNEKKAEEVLGGETGLPYFIPKQYAVRVYHGKKTRRLVPVIPGLVFVRAAQAAICDFKKRHNFLQFVMKARSATDKDYLVVPDKQMADFMRVAGQYETDVTYYDPAELQLEKGARVRILGGPFDGVEGTFMKVEGARARRLVVQIPNTLAAVVHVAPDLVEVIRD